MYKKKISVIFVNIKYVKLSLPFISNKGFTKRNNTSLENKSKIKKLQRKNNKQ